MYWNFSSLNSCRRRRSPITERICRFHHLPQTLRIDIACVQWIVSSSWVKIAFFWKQNHSYFLSLFLSSWHCASSCPWNWFPWWDFANQFGSLSNYWLLVEKSLCIWFDSLFLLYVLPNLWIVRPIFRALLWFVSPIITTISNIFNQSTSTENSFRFIVLGRTEAWGYTSSLVTSPPKVFYDYFSPSCR